jgi:TonB-dependent receptor-like protein
MSRGSLICGSSFSAVLPIVLCAVLAFAGSRLHAQTQELSQSPAVTLPTIDVKGTQHARRSGRAKPVRAAAPRPHDTYDTGAPNVAGGPAAPATMASQTTVSGRDLNARPVTRPAELLEAAPGLAVVMHADGGKANQYYLRGYNLDHGTDLAIFVDDMPINLPSHVHDKVTPICSG